MDYGLYGPLKYLLCSSKSADKLFLKLQKCPLLVQSTGNEYTFMEDLTYSGL